MWLVARGSEHSRTLRVVQQMELADKMAHVTANAIKKERLMAAVQAKSRNAEDNKEASSVPEDSGP